MKSSFCEPIYKKTYSDVAGLLDRLSLSILDNLALSSEGSSGRLFEKASGTYPKKPPPISPKYVIKVKH